jgi:hypothetical protein
LQKGLYNKIHKAENTIPWVRATMYLLDLGGRTRRIPGVRRTNNNTCNTKIQILSIFIYYKNK